MTLSRIIDKQLLLDTGDENEIYNKTHLIELENSKQIEFTTRELIEFADAEKKIDLPRLYTAVREQLQNRKTLEFLEKLK